MCNRISSTEDNMPTLLIRIALAAFFSASGTLLAVAGGTIIGNG
jgi:hypothetical protein